MTVAVETVKPQWRDPEFGHRLVRLQEAEEESPRRPLVLILGTSRTQNSIQPSAMGFSGAGSPRVFNFGQSGSPPLKVLLTLLRVLDAGIHPDGVLVEILPPWLGVDGPAEDQLGDKVAQLSAADLHRLAPYCANPEALWSRWRAARVAPWYVQRMVLMSHWAPRWSPWQVRVDFQWEKLDGDGFSPLPYDNPPPETRAAGLAHTHAEYVGAFGTLQRANASLRAMRDLVARCRTEGIPVAFFVPPVAPTFRAWFDPGVWSADDKRVRDLAHELNVKLFPAPLEFTDDDFLDGHHLLRVPARRYSRWLAEVQIRPWLAGR